MTFPKISFKKLVLSIITFGTAFHLSAQTISVDDNYAQEIGRIRQVLGKDSSGFSFSVRPMDLYQDSLLNRLAGSRNLAGDTSVYSPGIVFRILPVSLLSEYNLNRPYGYNNGPLYPNRGLQELFSTGFYFRLGFLKVQAKPEFVYAQNKSFPDFADVQGGNDNARLMQSYFAIVNGIDAPERFGNSPLQKFYPGQSKVTLNFGKVEIGVSTENMWWGPGVKNSIMMSNSAPGFLHWTFNSSAPVKTSIGTFEWQLIGGYLNQSGYLPTDTNKLIYGHNLFMPKPSVTRYLSAYTINWHPKWMTGFFVGFSEYSYMNIDSMYRHYGLIKKIIPVIAGSSNQANTVTANSNGDNEDFAFAINFRQVFEKEKAEIYFEWARNDHWANLSDLLQEPEHSSAYTLGGRKLYDLAGGRFIQVKLELTHLQNSPTYLLREEPTWYVHLQAPQDGYTNDGRYVGAGIGPGSNSLMLDLSYINGENTFGLQLERFVHDNDLYYNTFSGTNTFSQHWVDIAGTFYANYKANCFLISSELTPVYTYNYEYKKGDSFNLHARINLTYYFN
ncbi:MAG TPA: hypothetical protein VHE59_08705 [Mucilaginibacter sp.]|nr:hypothetical protein [Mucilaginibacter sp.]